MTGASICERLATFKSRSSFAMFVLLAAVSSPAVAQAPRATQVGMLKCSVAPSIGFIVGSRQTMSCLFTPNGAFPPQTYTGVINTVGLDVGVTAGGVMAWAVIAPTAGPPAGGLAGLYVGASGEIGVGLGVGANALIGGSNRSVALQPLSVEGEVGVNLALGVSGLELQPAP